MALIRSLRVLILAALGILIAGIVFSLSSTRFVQRAEAEIEPGDASHGIIAQHAVDVEMLRTHRGTPTLRLQARESKTYLDSRIELETVEFRIRDSQGNETLVEAPRATSMPAEAGKTGRARAVAGDPLGSWLLEGGVTIKGARDLTLTTQTLAYFESEGRARTNEPVSFSQGAATGRSQGMIYEVEPRIVRFSSDVAASMEAGGMGLVRVNAESAVYGLEERTFEMAGYKAITGRGEDLTGTRLVVQFGEAGGMQRLEGDRGFVLETSHTNSPGPGSSSPLGKLLAQEGTRTLSGERLAVVFDESTTPRTIEISGDALLTARKLDSAEASRLAARVLVFDLEQGNLTLAKALGGVDLQGAPRDGESSGLHLLGDNLEAAFDPEAGSILRVEGQGEIRLTDEEMKSQGSRTTLDPNSDIWVLSGEEGSPASTTWLERTIQGRRIEVNRRARTLKASGGVRASYSPEPDRGGDDSTGALPFFKGGETIYAMAGSLTLSEEGRRGKYEDRVRLWQGENRVESSSLDLDESAGTLEARGDVISTFRLPPPEGGSTVNPSEQIVTVAAATMKYQRDAGQIIYSGNVLVTQGPMRLSSETMTVTLSEDGSEAERMQAAGKVEMRDAGRLGRGDTIVIELKKNTMTLSGKGREATVQDEAGQQVVRGSSLTMDRAGDRILVESELGGRTWITLKPRQKGAPSLASDPQN